MELNLTRHGAAVQVIGDDSTLAWIRFRTLHGFEHSSNRLIGSWQVIGGTSYAPSGPWERYARHYESGEVCHFLISLCRRQIVVDHPVETWRNLYVLRMIRNILRWEMFKKGAIFLHASSVSRSGEGLALMGARRSGKSSLMLSALRSGQWDYVTEDDLTLIPFSGNQFIALGWPGSLRVRRSMLPHYPEILVNLDRLEHPANQLEANLDPEIGMVRIFPEELARIFGCSIVPDTTLSYGLWARWGDLDTVVPLNRNDVCIALERSWDILPERKAGASRILATESTFRDQVFDPFLLKYYGIPDLSLHRQYMGAFANGLNGYQLVHSGVLLPSICERLIAGEKIHGGPIGSASQETS